MRRIGRTAPTWTVAALALVSLLLPADRVISDAAPGAVAPSTTGHPRELTADEWWTLDRAEALLIAACMRRAGGSAPARAAADGSAHKWGGECRAGEPHIPFP
jgi:hypothetical protein